MVTRRWWRDCIESAWERRPVVWLAGVRRAGKTYLCRSIGEVAYFDCELPRARRLMDDPEAFLESLDGRRIVLDEIHRLSNPSELLKIAADHFPSTRVLATGSSTLGASSKFRDVLTGRKESLWLTPILRSELGVFGRDDLPHRLLHGGLPPFFLATDFPEREIQEWMDAYWAKDVQELFRLERRASFQRFAELLLAQSGGIFEATRFARPCEVSRQTIVNYLAVLEATFVVHIVRPFTTRRATEIVAAPKVYGFDTGFVSYFRGWSTLRQEDLGPLWEHLVLNEIQGRLQQRTLRYWRTKQGQEVDFVLTRRGRQPPIVIECKRTASSPDLRGLTAFLKAYPEADAYVVAIDVDRTFTRRIAGVPVRFVSLESLIQALETEPLTRA